MAQVFEQSNRELLASTASADFDLLKYDMHQPSHEVFNVNILYMLSSLGFANFRDFEEHFSTSFVELRTPEQVSVFKNNFFVLLTAIQQICLQSHTSKTNPPLGSLLFNSFIDSCNRSQEAGHSFFETDSNQISFAPF